MAPGQLLFNARSMVYASCNLVNIDRDAASSTECNQGFPICHNFTGPSASPPKNVKHCEKVNATQSGQTDGQTYEWTVRWTNGRTDRRTDRWMNRQTDRQKIRRTDRLTIRQAIRRMTRLTDGRRNGHKLNNN